MLAPQVRDVDVLNRLAREHLRATGDIEARDTVIGDRTFAIGDEVLTTRNDYDHGLLNGTRAAITDIDAQRGDIQARTTDGTDLAIPSGYIEAGNLRHGYATTLHKAQGTTVQHSFVLVRDTIDREHAYSGFSRGTDSNTIYLTEATHRLDEQHAPELEPSALDRLATGLRTSSAKSTALDLGDGLGPQL